MTGIAFPNLDISNFLKEKTTAVLLLLPLGERERERVVGYDVAHIRPYISVGAYVCF